MRVFLNAGHSIYSTGAQFDSHKESELTIQLRDIFLSMSNRVEIVSVPDNLNLRQSIDWVNARADINDIAFSIHFNSNNNHNIGGTEVYYSNGRERHLSEIFSRTVSKALGINNRGAKHDSQTWVGSLGWLRQLKCDSVLIEICYLTNSGDMASYNKLAASRGLQDAIDEIIPRKVPEEAEKLGRDADLKKLESILSILARMVADLREHISKLLNK